MRDYTYQIDKGYQFKTRLQYFDDADLPIDLNGYTANIRFFDRKNVELDITSTCEITENQIDITILTSETSKFTMTEYSYVIEIEKDEEKFKLVGGLIKVV
jgi:hypothetical protein